MIHLYKTMALSNNSSTIGRFHLEMDMSIVIQYGTQLYRALSEFWYKLLYDEL